MNIRHHRQLRERLAAEYVLGTLRGGARRRFERWMQEEGVVRLSVEEWRSRLYPMAELAPAAQPSAAVWRGIEQRIQPAAPPERRSWLAGLRDNLAFWRGLGTASTAVAAVLATVMLIKEPEPSATFVATLAGDNAQAAMVVTGDSKRKVMTIRMLAPQPVTDDKSLELWAIPHNGPPRSLGLLAAEGATTLPMPDNATPSLTPVFAVSLEPKGGSPDPTGPSGPVLMKGAWVQL